MKLEEFRKFFSFDSSPSCQDYCLAKGVKEGSLEIQTDEQASFFWVEPAFSFPGATGLLLSLWRSTLAGPLGGDVVEGNRASDA